MVEHVAPPAGGLDGQFEPLAHLALADELLEALRPQGQVQFPVGTVQGFAGGMLAHEARG